MKNCLVVDDSKVVRMVARKILADLKFDIREATNGEEALNACKQKMPDAVLLDWNMPVMDGIDFLRELRRIVQLHPLAIHPRAQEPLPSSVLHLLTVFPLAPAHDRGQQGHALAVAALQDLVHDLAHVLP